MFIGSVHSLIVATLRQLAIVFDNFNNLKKAENLQNFLPNFTMTLKQLANDLNQSFTCELVIFMSMITYSWS